MAANRSCRAESEAASTGSEFNFYLCELNGSITIPEISVADVLKVPETTLDLTGAGASVGGQRCEQPGYDK